MNFKIMEVVYMLSGIQMLNDTLKIINQGFYIKNGKKLMIK